MTARILVLEKENSELRDKLGLNSTNSSLPPSKDLYKIEKENKPKSTLKIGAQPGHIGKNRARKAPDKIIHCYAPETCNCGGRIIMHKKPEIQQKIEIPPITPIYTDYILHKGRCKNCNKKYSGTLPQGVSQNMLAAHAKTIVTSLTGYYKNSKSEVQQILKNIFNLEISTGTISNTEARVSDKCERLYDEYCHQIQNSDHLHIDETGAKKQGKRHWAWCFTDQKTTVLKIEKSRSKEVLKKMLPNFTGTIISDRYGSYNYFNANQRQICWAHLIRDFNRFANSNNSEVKKIGIQLKNCSRFLFKNLKSFKENVLALQKGHPEKIASLLTKKYNMLCTLVSKIKQAVRSRLEKIMSISDAKHASRVAKRILKLEEMMWKFMDFIFTISPTNNLAERQIRPFVIYRKNSFFVWSERGAKFVERMNSILLTSNLRKLNSFQVLHEVIKS